MSSRWISPRSNRSRCSMIRQWWSAGVCWKSTCRVGAMYSRNFESESSASSCFNSSCAAACWRGVTSTSNLRHSYQAVLGTQSVFLDIHFQPQFFPATSERGRQGYRLVMVKPSRGSHSALGGLTSHITVSRHFRARPRPSGQRYDVGSHAVELVVQIHSHPLLG